MVGQHGMNGREDGSYANSKLQRTWFLLTDKDGTVFFVDEGRGQTLMVHSNQEEKFYFDLLGSNHCYTPKIQTSL